MCLNFRSERPLQRGRLDVCPARNCVGSERLLLPPTDVQQMVPEWSSPVRPCLFARPGTGRQKRAEMPQKRAKAGGAARTETGRAAAGVGTLRECLSSSGGGLYACSESDQMGARAVNQKG